MPKWTEKQLKDAWEKKSDTEKLKYGSYANWKAGIIYEVD